MHQPVVFFVVNLTYTLLPSSGSRYPLLMVIYNPLVWEFLSGSLDHQNTAEWMLSAIHGICIYVSNDKLFAVIIKWTLETWLYSYSVVVFFTWLLIISSGVGINIFEIHCLIYSTDRKEVILYLDVIKESSGQLWSPVKKKANCNVILSSCSAHFQAFSQSVVSILVFHVRESLLFFLWFKERVV